MAMLGKDSYAYTADMSLAHEAVFAQICSSNQVSADHMHAASNRTLVFTVVSRPAAIAAARAV
jgi:hypothetical protein